MRIVLILCLSIVSCHDITKLNKNCPHWCYTGPLETRNLGNCRDGVPVCDDDLNVIECRGERTPKPESCDGIDNNCNGNVDEGIRPNLLPCLNTGVCRWATVKSACIDGEYICIKPEHYEETEVSCDGLDNDCDGIVDNVLSNNQFCFDDDWWKATNAPCRPGLTQCGSCIGQVLPLEEICDGIDNDCDGGVDNIINGPVDFVFIIDPSGSMCGYMAAVVAASIQFVENNRNLPIRWAMIHMSAYGPPFYEVITDFTDASSIISVLSNTQCGGAAYETYIDAQYQMCERNLLDWKNPGMTAAFTDELPISGVGVSPWDVELSCLQNDVRPYLWGNYSDPWYSIMAGAGGGYFPLVWSWADLLSGLMSMSQCN